MSVMPRPAANPLANWVLPAPSSPMRHRRSPARAAAARPPRGPASRSRRASSRRVRFEGGRHRAEGNSPADGSRRRVRLGPRRVPAQVKRSKSPPGCRCAARPRSRPTRRPGARSTRTAGCPRARPRGPRGPRAGRPGCGPSRDRAGAGRPAPRRRPAPVGPRAARRASPRAAPGSRRRGRNRAPHRALEGEHRERRRRVEARWRRSDAWKSRSSLPGRAATTSRHAHRAGTRERLGVDARPDHEDAPGAPHVDAAGPSSPNGSV